MANGAFFLSFILLCLVVYHVLLCMSAGVYPSRYILQRRAVAFSIGAVLLLIIGFLLKRI